MLAVPRLYSPFFDASQPDNPQSDAQCRTPPGIDYYRASDRVRTIAFDAKPVFVLR